MEKQSGKQSQQTENTYQIRPNFKNKFRSAIVKDILHSILNERLTGTLYHSENTSQLCREISDEIKGKLKELNLARYKYIVQVVIGEQRGEGVKMAARCFWDADTDNYATETFINESLFCVAAAYGVFLY
eukprot:TRINITY_DN8580_c0_g1_i1.p1 TRINITY_DN8580_c0_g1~~TRINITY_DN8580_c0_g1_i1.p1  ORF type:complete len:130 (-),score=15.67 TRINITY_DN8580_c0_g1_i1:29-418(-)